MQWPPHDVDHPTPQRGKCTWSRRVQEGRPAHIGDTWHHHRGMAAPAAEVGTQPQPPWWTTALAAPWRCSRSMAARSIPFEACRFSPATPDGPPPYPAGRRALSLQGQRHQCLLCWMRHQSVARASSLHCGALDSGGDELGKAPMPLPTPVFSKYLAEAAGVVANWRETSSFLRE